MLTLKAPLHSIKGNLTISGSKSLSNRLLILEQVLKTQFTFENLSDSEDTKLLIEALDNIRSKKQNLINIHHAGTNMRFLTAYLSVTEGDWILTGSERMKERPIGALVNALVMLGASIRYLEKENYPPLAITGKTLDGGPVKIDGSISSQFLSAILLVAPRFKKGLSLIIAGKSVSRPYLDMTLAFLKQVGMEVLEDEGRIEVIVRPSRIQSTSFHIESDWSSASYFYSICALKKGSSITLRYYDQQSLQGDSILPHLFEKLGVITKFKNHALELSSGNISTSTFEYDFSNCPDLAQTLAVTCFGLGIEARLTGLQTLRIKESNRIVALKQELEKFGAIVIAGSDFLHIKSPNPKLETQNLKPESRNLNPETISIDTYNDHRMAMSFAPLSLIYGALRIDDREVVKKSYPLFWDDLISLGFSVNLQP